MPYNIPEKPPLIRNAIRHQNKGKNEGLSLQEWNDIINVLKEQTNSLTAYVEDLHVSLWGTRATVIREPLYHIIQKEQATTPVSNGVPTIIITSNNNVLVNTVGWDPLHGVSAEDPEDGDLTGNISYVGGINLAVPGDYTYVYSVTDQDGNRTRRTRVVTVYDDTGTPPPPDHDPVISGATNRYISIGTNFDPLSGVTATDAEDGSLTHLLTVQGTVNTSIIGVYTLTYTVTDSANNTTTHYRTLHVYQPEVSYVDDTSEDEGTNTKMEKVEEFFGDELAVIGDFLGNL